MDELSRRQFLSSTARTCFGVTIGGSAAQLFSNRSMAAVDPAVLAAGGGKAKSVIYLFMSGGLTHLDTFDPKPEAKAETRGDSQAIGTNVDGVQLGAHLPLLAQQMDKVSLVRSMNSTQGAHEQGRYFMRTGFQQRSSIVHPSTGAWVNKLTGKSESTLPSFVTINCGNQHPGAGFFEPSYAPLPIGKAEEGLPNVKRSGAVTEDSFLRQLSLREKLDSQFDKAFSPGQKKVRAYNEMFDAAVKLMHSKDLEAFDLKKESEATHALYGSQPFAKGTLLARRLVERGAKFVEVEFGGFDWHDDLYTRADEKLPVLDQALAALLKDLEIKGLLDSTLVVLATEFGRTPKINQNVGRDHFPKAFSCLMAGAGIKGGFVHGQTDETGANVITDKTSATDFNATIGHALGIPHSKELYSPSKRPFKMSGKSGKPILDLFG